MKLLREYIWQLLSEAALGVDDLISNDFYIKIQDDGRSVSLSLSDKDGNVTPAPEDQRRSPRWLKHYGDVSIYPPDDHYGNCSGAWMVASSEAMKGWGPLLYDVAIEYSTMRGGGLSPDRTMVSDEAKRVWDYYLKNRSDVTAHQLDNLEDELTPGYKPDNCVHRSTEEEHEEDIRTSSLSRRYTKKPTVMTALRKAGRIID